MPKLRWKIAQAAEIRWWQSYLAKRSKPDYLEWKRQYWRTLLERTAVQIKSGSRILDAGCGPAGIFMIFPEHEVAAVDPLLAEYEEKLDHYHPADYPWVKFAATALEDFESDVPFDTVFCLNAINHVDDLAQSFDRLVELTKPGGTLVVSIDAHNHSWLKQIFRLLPGDILHPHQYDLPEYEAMLTERGCEIEQRILYNEGKIFNYYVLVAKKAKKG